MKVFEKRCLANIPQADSLFIGHCEGEVRDDDVDIEDSFIFQIASIIPMKMIIIEISFTSSTMPYHRHLHHHHHHHHRHHHHHHHHHHQIRFPGSTILAEAILC